MLSNKQKLDQLMESLEAVESDSERLNEAGDYQFKNVEVAFNDRYSNDPHIAFAIEKLKDALWDLKLIGKHIETRPSITLAGERQAMRDFVLKKFKRHGFDIEKMFDKMIRIPEGDFNYTHTEKSDSSGQGGPFDA